MQLTSLNCEKLGAMFVLGLPGDALLKQRTSLGASAPTSLRGEGVGRNPRHWRKGTTISENERTEK